MLLGDLLTLHSLWTPEGRVSEWNVGDLVLICPQSPLRWAVDGRWSGCFSSRRQWLHRAPGELLSAFTAIWTTGKFSPGVALLFPPSGAQLYASQDPPAWGFGSTICNSPKLVTVKTHGKNSCIPLHADFIPWSGIKTVPLSLWFWISHQHQSFCLLKKSQCNS